MAWIDLTPDLTKKGQKNLQVGQVLMFRKDGQENNLKITRKHKGKVWAKFVHMYRPEEIKDLKIVKRGLRDS